MARVTAWFRALESARPDALFDDPHGEPLAGARGQELAAQLGTPGLMARSIAVRTAVFDRLILECVGQRGVDCIVNLGAGLDSRPWRLELPSQLRWIDVDRPAILEHKRATLTQPPRCHYTVAPADLDSPGAPGFLQATAGTRALVVSEGLLVYLSPQRVAALARELAGPGSGCRFWLTDLVGPRSLAMLQAVWEPALRARAVNFRFGPDESSAFFAPCGWEELSFLGALEEGRRLGRVRLPWATRLALWLGSASRREEFHRLAGTALLERRAAAA